MRLGDHFVRMRFFRRYNAFDACRTWTHIYLRKVLGVFTTFGCAERYTDGLEKAVILVTIFRILSTGKYYWVPKQSFRRNTLNRLKLENI